MNDQLLNQIKKIIQGALEEDIGRGDITTLSIVPVDENFAGRLMAREEGIIAGLKVAQMTFTLLDNRVVFQPLVSDGDPVTKGQILAQVSGPGQALLSGERAALNFLQRMSGIATLTRKFVNTVRGTSVIILDTRKTAPGLRVLDKWAVRLGGGQNHRSGLYDMVLIKENHIAVAGSITEAVRRVKAWDERKLPIVVEVKSLEALTEALELNIDRILLDNMDIDSLKNAVKITAGKIPLEASGNISLENIAEVARTGVDYISIGMITHSVRALDISFLLESHD